MDTHFDFHGVPGDILYVRCKWLAYAATLLHMFLDLSIDRGDMNRTLDAYERCRSDNAKKDEQLLSLLVCWPTL